MKSISPVLSFLPLLLVCLAPSASGFTQIVNHPRFHPSSKLATTKQSAWRKNQRSWTQPQQRQQQSSQLQAFPVAPHVLTSVLPPFLGFYKSEYTVSLGYGFSVALTALALLRQFSPSPILSLHASALLFYGVRLNIFLVLRNRLSQRIQEFNTKVEERAKSRGNRMTRTPFILSCGMLYYGLVTPLWFTGKLLASSVAIPTWGVTVLKTLIAAQWLGYAAGAIGDLTKTYVKQSQKDEKYLVTSGIFSWIRHPNYSGEILAWTANALTGLVAASLWISSSGVWPSVAAIANLGLLALGWIGILFVLLRATSNLEERQRNEYISQPKYQTWIENSWGGWQLPPKEAIDQATPQIELEEDQEEESGSGI